MDSEKNVVVDILELFTEKQKYDKKINNTMFNFLTRAPELVDLSDDIYQIEHSIILNKISLKDYILSSELCKMLKENNIKDYSTEILKKYMVQYENKSSINIYPYKLALELYEELEELENIESIKITYEMDKLGDYIEIKNIVNLSKKEYQNFYDTLVKKIRIEFLNNNLIDDKIYNYIIQILNDIFNYYLYGSKEIPIINEN